MKWATAVARIRGLVIVMWLANLGLAPQALCLRLLRRLRDFDAKHQSGSYFEVLILFPVFQHHLNVLDALTDCVGYIGQTYLKVFQAIHYFSEHKGRWSYGAQAG